MKTTNGGKKRNALQLWSLRDHTRPRNGCNLVGPAGTYCLGILPPRWSLPRLNNFDGSSVFSVTFVLACKHSGHDFWCQTVRVKTLLRFFRSATFDHSRVHEVFSVFAFSEKKVKTVLGRYLKVNLKKFKIGSSF